jgi:hypothetical protein
VRWRLVAAGSTTSGDWAHTEAGDATVRMCRDGAALGAAYRWPSSKSSSTTFSTSADNSSTTFEYARRGRSDHGRGLFSAEVLFAENHLFAQP